MKTLTLINWLTFFVVFPIVYAIYPDASIWTYFFVGGALGVINLFVYQLVIRIWPHTADKD